MFRKILCGLVALGAVVALGLPVMAGEELGSIQVTLADGEAAAESGAVMLYHVGVPSGPDYCLTEAFGSGIIKGEDALSPVLAKWLADAVEVEGEEKALNGAGTTKFFDLPQGLYLLVQSQETPGFYPMEPLLVTLPYEHQWHVQAYPKFEQMDIPATGQTLEPFVGGIGMLLSGSGLALCGRKRRK